MSQFNKQDTNNLGVEYDYGSVMHYQFDAFSKRSGLATMQPVNTSGQKIVLGNRNGPDAKDILKINKLYNCPS